MKNTNFDNIQFRTMLAADEAVTIDADDTNLFYDDVAIDFVTTLPDPKDISSLRKRKFFIFRNAAKSLTIKGATGLKSTTGTATRSVLINGSATLVVAADLDYVTVMAIDSENYVVIG